MAGFTLLENAEDSLRHAITHIKDEGETTPGDWKRVISDLAHVVELLVKERLRCEHPAFVYAQVDKYLSPDAFTVGAEQAIKRLQKISAVTISQEDLKAIETTRKKRNEIEHFEFSVDSKTYKLIVGQILGVILRFGEEHLDLEWRSICEEGGSKLLGVQEYYKQQIVEAEKLIDESDLQVIACAECGNETHSVEQERCLVCGHKERPEQCITCGDLFLPSEFDYEDPVLCQSCEFNEGWANHHFERV